MARKLVNLMNELHGTYDWESPNINLCVMQDIQTEGYFKEDDYEPKLVEPPTWMMNYKYPNYETIEKMRIK